MSARRGDGDVTFAGGLLPSHRSASSGSLTRRERTTTGATNRSAGVLDGELGSSVLLPAISSPGRGVSSVDSGGGGGGGCGLGGSGRLSAGASPGGGGSGASSPLRRLSKSSSAPGLHVHHASHQPGDDGSLAGSGGGQTAAASGGGGSHGHGQGHEQSHGSVAGGRATPRFFRLTKKKEVQLKALAVRRSVLSWWSLRQRLVNPHAHHWLRSDAQPPAPHLRAPVRNRSLALQRERARHVPCL
jgi:hypothetical protein